MSPLSVILTSLLGTGGISGAIALFRLRADKGATVVETVSKGVLVLDRLNTMLEGDLQAERLMRRQAEHELDEYRKLYGPLPEKEKP